MKHIIKGPRLQQKKPLSCAAFTQYNLSLWLVNGIHIFPLFQLAAERVLAKYTQIPTFRQIGFSLLIKLKLVKLVMVSTKKKKFKSSKGKCALFNNFLVWRNQG